MAGTTVESWLRAEGLQQFEKILVESGFDELEICKVCKRSDKKQCHMLAAAKLTLLQFILHGPTPKW